MKKFITVLSLLLLSSLLNIKATQPNCNGTLGSVTWECRGAVNDICMRYYDSQGVETICYGTLYSIPDIPKPHD